MSSDDFHIGGEIEIRPPVPAGKLAGSKFLPDTAKEQDSEVFVIIDGAHRSIIVPTDPEGITGYPDSVIDDVAALITLIGDGHTYHGALRIEDPAGLANGNPPSRVRIVNGGDGWVVAREQSEYIYPADYTIPNGPAVTFDRDAATAWLTETVLVGGVETVRAHEFGIDRQHVPAAPRRQPGRLARPAARRTDAHDTGRSTRVALRTRRGRRDRRDRRQPGLPGRGQRADR